MQKKDITTAVDIKNIMQSFYKKLLSDDRISAFFTKATTVSEHLDDHLDLLTTFWQQSLFQTGGYFNNMFEKHKDVHQKMNFTEAHYQIWLDYFFESIDENYAGETVERMKNQALSMATIMKVKGLV